MNLNDLTDDKMDDFLFKGLVAVLIVVLGALLVYSFLNVEPETFSQVYFIPDEIVHSASVGQSVPVVFEIDNREGKTVEYSYKLSFMGKTLKESSVTVENNERKRISEEILFDEATDGKQKFLVEVSKPGMDTPYSVWFWIQVE